MEKGISKILLSDICGEGILWVECLRVDIFETLSFDVDGFRVSSEPLKGEVNIIVVLVDDLYMCQAFALL